MRRVCRLGFFFFFFQAEDGIRDLTVTGVQTCALPIWCGLHGPRRRARTSDPVRRRPGRDALLVLDVAGSRVEYPGARRPDVGVLRRELRASATRAARC